MFGKLAREPLVHFVLIGAVIFMGYGLLSVPEENAPSTEHEIHVTPERVIVLTREFEAVWRRPPTPAERLSLVESFVRDEVLMREALRLGLDRDDTVIRRRLVQKMAFLSESAARAGTPGDDTLRAHLDANAAAFAQPGRIGFEQIFLGENGAATDLDAVRAALDAGTDPRTLGQRTILPFAIADAPAVRVDGQFGTGVFDAISALADGGWQGPVRSGYGLHLVRITERTPAVLPPFESIRAGVLADWRRREAEAIVAARFNAMRAQYRIIMPGDAR